MVEAQAKPAPTAPFTVMPPRLIALVVIALAGMALRLPVTVQYPVISCTLFGWIVTDSLMVSLIASTPGCRPTNRAIVATLAGAAVTFVAGLNAPTRAMLLTHPLLVLGLTAPVAAQVIALAVSAWRSRSITTVFAEIIPAPLLRLARAEWAILCMALLRWGGPADVPAGALAFTYHRHLAPMAYALLTLASIEAAVYHLLISHFSHTAAIVLFILSDVTLIYLVGLIKSFRYCPILIERDGLRIRTGLLIDRFIPFADITALVTAPDGGAVRDPATLNAALLAWPNLLVRCASPQRPRSALRRTPITAIAFRLDDPIAFTAALQAALARQSAE